LGIGLIKIKDKYFEWSTIVDAPVTLSMSLRELKAYTKSEYGKSGMNELEERIHRCEMYGTSFMGGGNVEDIVSRNRAGFEEACLTMDEIYNIYRNKKNYNRVFKDKKNGK
jgi:hypothetical protein